MNLRCKVDDIAFMVKSCAGNEGKICKVLKFLGENPIFDGVLWCIDEGPCWLVEYPSKTRTSLGDPFTIMPCPDAFLRPIRPNEEEDESLSWSRPVVGEPA